MSGQTGLKNSVNYATIALIGNLIVSFGIILVTAGGSWDITNHILHKPETFFAPPHAVLYSGVGIALFGFFVLYLGWIKSNRPQHLRKGTKIIGIGIALLLAAGPADFIWHENFGLDGLLSPPHLVLISGMMLSSMGALLNSARCISEPNRLSGFLIAVSLIPVWFSVTGLFYSFSLPFSETDYFNYNPHPVFAAVFASTAYPFLISAILVTASSLFKHGFGTASVVGTSYVMIMTLTAIVPNDSLVDTVPFYLLNLIPIVVGDAIMAKIGGSRALYVAGAVFGSSFALLYYPLITYTYNEILFERVMWPSLTSHVYFEMLPVLFPLLACVGSILGILGARFATELAKKMKNPTDGQTAI